MATRSSSRATAAPMRAGGHPRFSGPKATSSATRVVTIWSSGFWNTMEMRERASA